VVSAGTAHDDLLLSRGFFAPQREKSSHNSQSSFPGPPLAALAPQPPAEAGRLEESAQCFGQVVATPDYAPNTEYLRRRLVGLLGFLWYGARAAPGWPQAITLYLKQFEWRPGRESPGLVAGTLRRWLAAIAARHAAAQRPPR
jgi:hypothetical protein